jgi:hypothetical protein
MPQEVMVRNKMRERLIYLVYTRQEAEVEGLSFRADWREGEVGEWVLTDDEFVVQIIATGRVGIYKTKWIRTVHGAFLAYSKTVKLTTEKRDCRFTLNGKKSWGQFRLSSRMKGWVSAVVAGRPALEAYMDHFQTKNEVWARSRVAFLLRQPEILELMKKELAPLLERLGVTQEFVINGYLEMYRNVDHGDAVRFKCLTELAILTGVKEELPGKGPDDGYLGVGAVFDDFQRAGGRELPARSSAPDQDAEFDEAPTLEDSI